MGVKGLIRDTIMFVVGIQLLLGVGLDDFKLGVILVAVSVAFTAVAWYRFFNG
jgi:hypothetical protein